MLRSVFLLPALLLFVGAKDVRANNVEDHRVRYLVSALDRPVATFERGEFALLDTLELLSKLVGPPDAVTITLDVESFRRETMGMFDPERVQIKVSAKLVNARLDSHLQIVCDQLGAVVMVRNETIELVPRFTACKELGLTCEEGLPIRLVHRFFNKLPLDQALQQIAERYNQNIALSPHANSKKGTPITARLVNAPMDAAVESLAEMADLRVVRKANILLVTSKEHAEELIAEQEKKSKAKKSVELESK